MLNNRCAPQPQVILRTDQDTQVDQDINSGGVPDVEATPTGNNRRLSLAEHFLSLDPLAESVGENQVFCKECQKHVKIAARSNIQNWHAHCQTKLHGRTKYVALLSSTPLMQRLTCYISHFLQRGDSSDAGGSSAPGQNSAREG